VTNTKATCLESLESTEIGEKVKDFVVEFGKLSTGAGKKNLEKNLLLFFRYLTNRF